jgi:RHS repeat-associated protein
LGSTAVITDSTGTSLVKEKFAALGWNENSAAEQATMATVTRHEFTGHEGLDNTGIWLVNMNGRIYDPSGSMFLSPDTHVPDPGNTQSYNRYSYVNNNPLTEIDPTGFENLGGYKDMQAYNARHGKTLAIRQQAVANLFFANAADELAAEYGALSGGDDNSGGGGGEQYVVGTDSNGASVDQQGAAASVVSQLNAGQQTLAHNSQQTASATAAGTTTTNGGSATFQICQDGYACSEPINPDLLEVVPTAYPIVPLDTGAVVSVAGPVEFAAFGLAGVLRATAGGVAAAEGVDAQLSERVLQRMLEDPGPYHNFPFSIARQVLQGEGQVISSNYTLHTLEGAINGVRGVYEVGVNAANQITHYFFNPF